MARDEHDREDLMAEAQALIERVSLRIDGHEEQVLVGFRRDGSASCYFGPDPAYHFNSRGQLRRAFVGDLLFKAEGAQLVSLRRERGEQAVQLVSHVLNPNEADSFLDAMRRHLDALCGALASGSYRIVGQVPQEADVVARVRAWLDTLPARPAIADSPRAC
jgi:hypothetical protein